SMSEYKLGDVVETKKPHPCGSIQWTIIRTGMDYKIKCLGCGRIVMLSYEDFVRRVKRVVEGR
ncbi:MAG: DUF951 domain-containing protein, partial [Christensenellaceae bacterium]